MSIAVREIDFRGTEKGEEEEEEGGRRRELYYQSAATKTRVHNANRGHCGIVRGDWCEGTSKLGRNMD